MMLLLTILSVLVFWAFLHALMVGLLIIFKVLDGIVLHMQHIAMGVRAIERQTSPVGKFRDPIAGSLEEAASAISAIAARLGGAADHLALARPFLKQSMERRRHA